MKKEVHEKRLLQEEAIKFGLIFEPYFDVTEELITRGKIPP